MNKYNNDVYTCEKNIYEENKIRKSFEENKYLIHKSEACYMCNNKHFKHMKKKILDEFFFDIYNDYNMFVDCYDFIQGKKGYMNFLAFSDLIKKKKDKENLDRAKKKETGNVQEEGSASTFFPQIYSLVNYIKKKKSDKYDESNNNEIHKKKDISTSQFFHDSLNISKHDNGVDRSMCNYISKQEGKSKFINTFTNEAMDVCNDSNIKRDYFNLNFYLDYYNKKKNEFLNVAINHDEDKEVNDISIHNNNNNIYNDNIHMDNNNNNNDIHNYNIHNNDIHNNNDIYNNNIHNNNIQNNNIHINNHYNYNYNHSSDNIINEKCTHQATVQKQKRESKDKEDLQNNKNFKQCDEIINDKIEHVFMENNINEKNDKDKDCCVNNNNNISNAYLYNNKLYNDEFLKNTNNNDTPCSNKFSIYSNFYPDKKKKMLSNTSSDIYNLYSYIDIVCYNNLLYKNNSKIYKCFINYIYQPLIPHNIRSNNIINNFLKYVKFFKTLKKKKDVNSINDPNIYLNCNKLDSKLFFNGLYYYPFNKNMNNMPFSSPFFTSKVNISQEKKKNMINTYGDNHDDQNKFNDSFGLNIENQKYEDKNYVNPCDVSYQHNHYSNNSNHIYDDNYIYEKIKNNELKNDNPFNEILNNSILNNTWIKNKPELGLCKLMIYDHFLILYGTPYVCNVHMIGKRAKEAERKNKEQKNYEDKNKEDKNDEEKNDEEENYEQKNYEQKNYEQKKKHEIIYKHYNDESLNDNNSKICEEGICNNNPLDPGTENFLKERKEYVDKENVPFICYDDKFDKIIIHKYKDLKKKDILFNIECYKLDGLCVNWNDMSENIFHGITLEHINDTYNYYKSYFNLSKNNLSYKINTNNNQKNNHNNYYFYESSTSSCSSNTSCSNSSDDDVDFSFSDYHSLYKKKFKNKKKEAHKKQDKLSNQESYKKQIDAINVYGIFDLRTIHKITTKHKFTKTLYFYFSTNKSIPLMVLNFESELEVQSCISAVQEIYSSFTKK
ncbi:hypothetical protein PFLG_01299 [Plasmodium falciparum RAJ116]|uniref:Uncharacterized protein n=1 Tax=Plasmodium falciparum RAJ116 TaxID=580058 RepID=A0A0L0CX32_PLAFA|nr:hypothetical protein PFLG_01299 [Plasmodium falciparum RAJ116]